MKKDKEKTKTVFRMWPDGEVIALFPQIATAISGYECQSYQHIGQHSGANSWLVVVKTRPAKPEEYAELLKELRQIGYNVRIAKRCTFQDQQIRQRQYKI